MERLSRESDVWIMHETGDNAGPKVKERGMDIAPFIVTPERLSAIEEPWPHPVAFIELATAGEVPPEFRLPFGPLVGIGNAGGTWAARVDATVDTLEAAARLATRIGEAPRAAAALVQVLRLSAGIDVEQALTLESLAYAMLQGSKEHLTWRAAAPAAEPVRPGSVRMEREGGALAVTLDRPWSGNAIDRSMRDGLHEAFALVNADSTIEVVRLRGSGKAFSLGADLAEFGTTTDPAEAHAIRGLTLPAREAFRCAGRLHVHVDGACVGAGLELAAFAARITATPRSWFQLPELRMGIIPGAGGCVSLARRIGRQRTALMVLSGRRIGAAEALSWGLVDALVDDASGDDRGPHVG